MKNQHYRITYYSKEEAEAIVRRNEEMMTSKGRQTYKARTGISDRQEAKKLGLTIEDYLKLVV